MKMTADIILKGNHIFRGKYSVTAPGFVAIKGNKILAVESDLALLEDYTVPETKVIDCADGLIMPGFHDCHVHIIEGGIYNTGVDLTGCTSEEEAAKRVAEYAEAHPEKEWILGCGWYQIYWDSKQLPTKASLDRYVPDRPVFLENEDGHGAWVNTCALKLCGVTKDTPDPESGKIFRDENGEATGYLDELAMLLCGTSAFDLNETYEEQLLDDFTSKAVKFGVTSANDMRPFFEIDLGDLSRYEEAEASGRLPIRINFASNLFGNVDDAKSLRERYQGGKLHYIGMKQFIDGVAISYTSFMKDGYADKKESKGSPLVTREKLFQAVKAAHVEKIPVHLHVTGDQAIAMSLDAIEDAIKKYGDFQVPHSLEHLDLIDPLDIPRLHKLHVIASMQPEHMMPTESFAENPYPDRFGETRSRYAWAIGSIMRSGAEVAFGTDYPVAEIDPLQGVARAVGRLSDDHNPEGGWNPEEKISVEEALDAYTRGSAAMAGREHELGTLEAGKLADIAVVDTNLPECGVDEIRAAKVVLTICDGEIVYEAQ